MKEGRKVKKIPFEFNFISRFSNDSLGAENSSWNQMKWLHLSDKLLKYSCRLQVSFLLSISPTTSCLPFLTAYAAFFFSSVHVAFSTVHASLAKGFSSFYFWGFRTSISHYYSSIVNGMQLTDPSIGCHNIYI